MRNAGTWGAVKVFVKPMTKPASLVAGFALLQMMITLILNACIILASCHYVQHLLLINHDLRSDWHAISNWMMLPRLLQSRVHHENLSHCYKQLANGAQDSRKPLSQRTASQIAPLRILSKSAFHHAHMHAIMPASSVLQVTDCVMRRGIWVMQPSYYYLTIRRRGDRRTGSIIEKKQGEPARDLLQGCQSLRWLPIVMPLSGKKRLFAVKMLFACSAAVKTLPTVFRRSIEAILVA